VVGHIFFSPVEIDDAGAGVRAAGLGPMAVMPGRQRQGVGSRLIRAGLDACRQAGFDVVVVIGHPTYYPRFGFVPAARRGLRYEEEVPEDAFMLLELRAGSLGDGGGVVRYLPEFGEV
jgi:putative acetyltransferase